MRAFIAVSVPEEVKLKAHELQEKLDGLALDIKFVELHNLHFTLKFMGEVSDDDITKVQSAMLAVARQFAPFDVHIKGLIAFPRLSYPRVIACKTEEGGETLTALANTLSKALTEIGFEAEGTFEPHLTLARLRSPVAKPELITLLNSLKDVEIGRIKVESIKLIQSVLTRQGPVYTDLFTVKLG